VPGARTVPAAPGTRDRRAHRPSVIIGGLLVSTFLTLLVVPVLYLLFTKEPA